MSEVNTDDVKFSLETVNKTFANYKLNEIIEGVVVSKREDGVIFNLGGKTDAYISKSDFEDYESVKVGDRFKVVILKMRNEEGMIEVSKRKADEILQGSLEASKLKLGSTFSFNVTKVDNSGLHSRLGEYKVFVPQTHISKHQTRYSNLLNKKVDALVINIDHTKKNIVASIKMYEERIELNNQRAFWNSVFVNKLVSGVVESVAPFGAFVNVNGVICLCHISDVSHTKIKDVSQVLKVGERYTFRVIKVDREEKKVSLSYKVLQENPRTKLLKEIVVGKEYNGKVVKFLPFGAIIKLENDLDGLLHITEATNSGSANISDILRIGDEIKVIAKNVDLEKERLSLSLKNKL